jgi:hypothetical protein
LNLNVSFGRNEIHATSFRENKLVPAAVATPQDRFQAADSFFFWNTVSMNHWLMVAGQLGHMTLKGRKKSKPVTGCRQAAAAASFDDHSRRRTWNTAGISSCFHNVAHCGLFDTFLTFAQRTIRLPLSGSLS